MAAMVPTAWKPGMGGDGGVLGSPFRRITQSFEDTVDASTLIKRWSVSFSVGTSSYCLVTMFPTPPCFGQYMSRCLSSVSHGVASLATALMPPFELCVMFVLSLDINELPPLDTVCVPSVVTVPPLLAD